MVEAASRRMLAERRNNAIAFAVAVNTPKDLDKLLPGPPPPETPSEASKLGFVEERWW